MALTFSPGNILLIGNDQVNMWVPYVVAGDGVTLTNLNTGAPMSGAGLEASPSVRKFDTPGSQALRGKQVTLLPSSGNNNMIVAYTAEYIDGAGGRITMAACLPAGAGVRSMVEVCPAFFSVSLLTLI